MQKRINMILAEDETIKLDRIKSAIGLKTTTDTIRYLISSHYMRINDKPTVTPNPLPYNPNPFPYNPVTPYIGPAWTGPPSTSTSTSTTT